MYFEVREAVPFTAQVLLLERWMTMALAAHAADSGEKKEGFNNTKRTAGHSDSDSFYHPGPQPPRSASDAAIALAENGEHTAFRGMPLGRPGNPMQNRHGSVGVRRDDSAGTASGATTTRPRTAAAATAAGMSTPGCGVPEAGGHQDDGSSASPVDEERKAATIRAQMSVLMVGFFEIIRQVSNVVFMFRDQIHPVVFFAVKF